MKTRNPGKFIIQITRGLAFLLAVVLLVGCRSTGYIKSDATAWRLQVAAGEVRTESGNLDATMAALNDLVKRPSGDLRLQFRSFSQALDQLDASGKRTSGRAAGLRGKSAAYFETWDRELLAVSDEQIRQGSAVRKAEVSNEYEAAMRRYEGAQDALAPLIGYLQDIRKSLSTDLTTAGLQAATQPANNASEKAAKAQTELAQSAANLDGLGVKMSSFALQSAK